MLRISWFCTLITSAITHVQVDCYLILYPYTYTMAWIKTNKSKEELHDLAQQIIAENIDPGSEILTCDWTKWLDLTSLCEHYGINQSQINIFKRSLDKAYDNLKTQLIDG